MEQECRGEALQLMSHDILMKISMESRRQIVQAAGRAGLDLGEPWRPIGLMEQRAPCVNR